MDSKELIENIIRDEVWSYGHNGGSTKDLYGVDIAADRIQQNFCKPDVLSCKELLLQMMDEVMPRAKSDKLSFDDQWWEWRKVGAIKKVLRMIDERQAL